jgi:copper resistance protein B
MRNPSFHWPAVVAAAALACAPATAQHEPHTPPLTDPGQHSDHAAARASTGVTEADRAAAFPELGDVRMGDMMLENPLNRLVLLDRLEWRDSRDDAVAWDVDAWVGRDLTKLWVRTEGERLGGDSERAELELLYGRGFARWWEFVAGVRRDFEPGATQNWSAAGVRGTAPYRLEIEATAYVGSGGRTALRVETQRDLLVTNRWILQPQLELEWYGETDPARLRGAGLADAEIGLRLRYEIRREVAPYVGVARERSLSRTAELLRAAGRDTDDTQWVAGIRVWF